jgi:hypothetical protein
MTIRLHLRQPLLVALHDSRKECIDDHRHFLASFASPDVADINPFLSLIGEYNFMEPPITLVLNL